MDHGGVKETSGFLEKDKDEAPKIILCTTDAASY